MSVLSLHILGLVHNLSTYGRDAERQDLWCLHRRMDQALPPPLGLPASMHGSINAGGNVAKCAPLKGLVVTDQTDRLLRVPVAIYSFPDLVACLGSSESPYLLPPNLIPVLPPTLFIDVPALESALELLLSNGYLAGSCIAVESK